jgi:hypothetical protein
MEITASSTSPRDRANETSGPPGTGCSFGFLSDAESFEQVLEIDLARV